MPKKCTKNDCQRAWHPGAIPPQRLNLAWRTSYAGWLRCVSRVLEGQEACKRTLVSMPCRIAKQTIQYLIAKAILLATELTIYFNCALFRQQAFQLRSAQGFQHLKRAFLGAGAPEFNRLRIKQAQVVFMKQAVQK